MNHPEFNKIWKSAHLATKVPEDGDLFNQFKNQLEPLWKQYEVDGKLDFVSTARRLFDEDVKVFELIKDHLLEKDFINFKNDFINNDKIKEISQVRKADLVDPLYDEFKSEINNLLQSEDVLSKFDQTNSESFVLTLFNSNDQNISVTAYNFLKDILTGKKIKQLIEKIQLNEKLKTIWHSKLSRQSAHTFSSTVNNKPPAPIDVKAQDEDIFYQFKIELSSLWEKYKVDDELDFISTAERLFNEDMEALESIKDYLIEIDFTNFKNDFMNNEKIPPSPDPGLQLDRVEHVDPLHDEFKSEIIKLLEPLDFLSKVDKTKCKSFILTLFENNNENISDIVNDFFENILVGIKMKRLIQNIQANEKIKTIWSSNLSTKSNNTKSSESVDVTMKTILSKYNFTTTDIDKIVLQLRSNFPEGLQLIEDELTPNDYKTVKSELVANENVRNITVNTENIVTLSSKDKQYAELI
ncbi:unnamed protein product [Didymodactylos carnosus]|uniref:Uncharacterized protein n=1 Tax=Didymodactylos carnosus TaxID=1234261 RepID=A0A814GTD9_9BILA|nr:unnamed protein product [Didymodactylos carnosus]CAF3772148.1 unnamed protein product [Didymodactylos carnosus]